MPGEDNLLINGLRKCPFTLRWLKSSHIRIKDKLLKASGFLPIAQMISKNRNAIQVNRPIMHLSPVEGIFTSPDAYFDRQRNCQAM
ncbi:hypothetical protein HPP92_004262 [Vanilla planifolia]|uniref:Uncharacterized protein n=1 Tax=Vanilla planifolia TaxID=51239 RepID=A0A835VDG6_VANPL|nr:hypothetical protein HPP92_004262 [Vanilla planifolia]